MRTDYRFVSRVAELAARMVADGWPHGTFDNPDFVLLPGAGVESAMMRAAHHVWGGPGWWRPNMEKANACLRTIRWSILDHAGPVNPGYPANLEDAANRMKVESIARERWKNMSTDEAVVMLLLASRWILSEKPKF